MNSVLYNIVGIDSLPEVLRDTAKSNALTFLVEDSLMPIHR